VSQITTLFAGEPPVQTGVRFMMPHLIRYIPPDHNLSLRID